MELLDAELLAALHIAYGVQGINLLNLQRHTIDCVVRYRRLEEYLHTLCESLPCLLFEATDGAHHLRTPNCGSGLCLGSPCLFVLLYKFDIAVARSVNLHICHLGTYPYRQRQSIC